MSRKNYLFFSIIFIFSFCFLLAKTDDTTFFGFFNSNEYEYKLYDVYRGNDFITDFNVCKSETSVNGYDEIKIKGEDAETYMYTTPRNTFILKSLRDDEYSSSLTDSIQILSKKKWKSSLFVLNLNEIVKEEQLKTSFIFQQNVSANKKTGCIVNIKSTSSLLNNYSENRSCKKENFVFNDSLNSFFFSECEFFTHILVVEILPEVEASCRVWIFDSSQTPLDLLHEKPNPSKWKEKSTLIPIVEMESLDYGSVKCDRDIENKEKKTVITEREEEEEENEQVNFVEYNKNKVQSLSEENQKEAEKRKNERNEIDEGEYSLLISLEVDKSNFLKDKKLIKFEKNVENEFLRCAVKHDCNVLKGKKTKNRTNDKINKGSKNSYLEINFLKVYKKIKSEVVENLNHEYSYFDNNNKVLLKNNVTHDIINNNLKNSTDFLKLITMRLIKTINERDKNANDNILSSNDIFMKPCSEKKKNNSNLLNYYKVRASEKGKKETNDTRIKKILHEIFANKNTSLFLDNKSSKSKNSSRNNINNNKKQKTKRMKKIIVDTSLFSLLKNYYSKKHLLASAVKKEKGKSKNKMSKVISQEKSEKIRRLDVVPLTVRTINTIGNALAKGFENRMEIHQLLQADVQAKKKNVRNAAADILRVVSPEISPAFIPLQNVANAHNYLLAQNSFAPVPPSYVASSASSSTQRLSSSPFGVQPIMGVNPLLYNPNFSSFVQPMPSSSPPFAFNYHPSTATVPNNNIPNNNNNNNMIVGSDKNSKYNGNVLDDELQAQILMQNYLQNGQNFNRFVNERLGLIEAGKKNVEVAGETLVGLVKNYGGVLTDKKPATSHENILSQHTAPSLAPIINNMSVNNNNQLNLNKKKNLPQDNNVRNKYDTDISKIGNYQERNQNFIPANNQHLSDASHFLLQENNKNFQNIASPNNFPFFNNNNALQNSTLPYSNFSHYNSQFINNNNNNRFLHKNSSHSLN